MLQRFVRGKGIRITLSRTRRSGLEWPIGSTSLIGENNITICRLILVRSIGPAVFEWPTTVSASRSKDVADLLSTFGTSILNKRDTGFARPRLDRLITLRNNTFQKG